MPKGCSSRRSASDSRLTAALLALYAPYDPTTRYSCANATKLDLLRPSRQARLCSLSCRRMQAHIANFSLKVGRELNRTSQDKRRSRRTGTSYQQAVSVLLDAVTLLLPS